MRYDWKPLPGAEDRLNAAIAPLVVTVSEDEMPVVKPTSCSIGSQLSAGARQYDP